MSVFAGKHLDNEVQSIRSQLGTFEIGFRARCTKKAAQKLLLDGMFFYNGRACRPKVKHVGAGIYDAFLDGDSK